MHKHQTQIFRVSPLGTKQQMTNCNHAVSQDLPHTIIEGSWSIYIVFLDTQKQLWGINTHFVLAAMQVKSKMWFPLSFNNVYKNVMPELQGVLQHYALILVWKGWSMYNNAKKKLIRSLSLPPPPHPLMHAYTPPPLHESETHMHKIAAFNNNHSKQFPTVYNALINTLKNYNCNKRK